MSPTHNDVPSAATASFAQRSEDTSQSNSMASLTHGGAVTAAPAMNIAASGSKPMEVDSAKSMFLSTRINKISRTTTTCGKECPVSIRLHAIARFGMSSLTCQWLPSTFDETTDTTITRQLLLGSHVAEGCGDNQLLISTVTLPKDGTDWQASKKGIATTKMAIGRIKIIKRFKHDGEANRVIQPWCEELGATKFHQQVYIRRYPDGASHVCVCQGHTQEGFGLAWNPTGDQDQLVSAGNDGLVCLWKISGNAKNVQPLGIFNGHDGRVVEDVSWNHENPHQFVSVGDDKSIVFWDTRTRDPVNAIRDAHYTQ